MFNKLKFISRLYIISFLINSTIVLWVTFLLAYFSLSKSIIIYINLFKEANIEISLLILFLISILFNLNWGLRLIYVVLRNNNKITKENNVKNI